MPTETTCPQCETSLRVIDGAPEALTCPVCLAPMANPACVVPPETHRVEAIEDQVGTDIKVAWGLVLCFPILIGSGLIIVYAVGMSSVASWAVATTLGIVGLSIGLH